jgi:CcmD family protein
MTYLFAAYSVIWSGLFVYLLILSRSQSKLREELQALKREMALDEKKN